ncbi:MAG: HlyC/CorC family transporter [Lachnospiraceae bacterium]|nr:HlyC/CorC family transporter [Lachnospiraceae bacterium]
MPFKLKFLKSRGEDEFEDEIKSIVSEGTDSGNIEEPEARMINNIFELDDKEARDIMTHRENVTGFEGGMILDDVIKQMINSVNTRFPVYEENIDNIIGIIFFKDAVKAGINEELKARPIAEIENLVKDAVFIPETRKIDTLFRAMQARKIHMVIVVDEYGQTSGIVTMEDILEEIVGNILDEYDVDESNIRKLGGDTYIINGLTDLSELEETLDITFPDEGVETLNGFLTATLGHVPKSGEIFETDYGGYKFHVVQIRNHVIQKVRVQKNKDEEESKGD